MLEKDLEMLRSYKNISKSELARNIGDSVQNLASRFKLETLSEKDVERILEALGVNAEIIYTAENGKEIMRRKLPSMQTRKITPKL